MITKSRIRTSLIFLTVGAAILAPQIFPHAMPTVLRYAAAAVLLALAAWMTLALLLIVAFWVVLLIRSRKTIRKVPAETDIQVLGTFLNDGTEFTADHYGQDGVR
jgi:membrane protein implicated in regulation of membrane protease activity